MKKILIATAVALSLSAAAQAAESTAVLKVTGVLTNDACTPELDGGGVVDFGTKYINELSATEDNQLGYKDMTLMITCTAATKVGWSITDNHADTMQKTKIDNATATGYQVGGSSQMFGVGKTAGNVNIGAYSVSTERSITVDGGKKDLGCGYVNSDTWTPATTDVFLVAKSDGSNMFSVITSGSSDDLVPFMNAVFPLRIALAIQKTDALAITDNTPIDGQATITLHYL